MSITSLLLHHCFSDIIRKYNPNVKGFSVGTGNERSGNARLNVAVSGAIAK